MYGDAATRELNLLLIRAEAAERKLEAAREALKMWEASENPIQCPECEGKGELHNPWWDKWNEKRGAQCSGENPHPKRYACSACKEVGKRQDFSLAREARDRLLAQLEGEMRRMADHSPTPDSLLIILTEIDSKSKRLCETDRITDALTDYESTEK